MKLNIFSSYNIFLTVGLFKSLYLFSSIYKLSVMFNSIHFSHANYMEHLKSSYAVKTEVMQIKQQTKSCVKDVWSSAVLQMINCGILPYFQGPRDSVKVNAKT